MISDFSEYDPKVVAITDSGLNRCEYPFRQLLGDNLVSVHAEEPHTF